MDKARLLFVYPSPGNIWGELIDVGESICDGKPGVTHNDLPCHVAIIRADGRLQEATIDGVVYSDISKYAGCKIRAFALDAPDLQAGEAWADKQDGVPYAFDSVAAAFYFAMTGVALNWTPLGTDCSQLGINYTRRSDRQILGFRPAPLVRPDNLQDEVIKQGGEESEVRFENGSFVGYFPLCGSCAAGI